VLGNASFAFREEDDMTAIDYLQRAQALDPANWTKLLATHYAWALNRRVRPAEQVRASIDASRDAPLLLEIVQQMLVNAGQSLMTGRGANVDVEEVRSTTTALLGQVERMQPGSQSVVELMEGVRRLGKLVPGEPRPPVHPTR
jgi:hypothetical protein